MYKTPRIAILPLTLGAAALSLSPSLVAQTAHLVDIGGVNPNHTEVGINNAGQVAFSGGVYSNGTLTVLPAPPDSIGDPALPVAINAHGDVAGIGAGVIGDPFGLAYINGAFISFQRTGYGHDTGIASGINANGAVIGMYFPQLGQMPQGFVDFTATNTGGALGLFPGTVGTYLTTATAPFGINDSGLITGSADKQEPGSGQTKAHAFIFDSNSKQWTDLGLGVGYAINATGQVTGFSGTFGWPAAVPVGAGQAFIYSGGSSKLLGTLPGGTVSVGYAINSAAVVVGSSDLSGASGTHAFWYNGVLIDMNALISADDPLKPYVTLTQGGAINDSRMVVVLGEDSRDHLPHTYLLQTPSIDLAPGPLSFSTTAIGSTATAQTVTLTNSGTAAVTLGTPTITGAFTQTNTCSTSLAAGQSCTASVTFAPTANGNANGALTFVVDGLDLAVPLSGSAAPAVTATLSVSATTIVTGQAVTLTWSAPNATACTASGGGSNDGWAGNKAASGNQTLTESGAPATLAFAISCKSSASGFSAQASAKVAETAPPARSGGGGALDPASLAALASLLSLAAVGRYRLTRRGTNSTQRMPVPPVRHRS